MFNVNFRILAQLITPTFLRKPVVLAWLYAMLAPVVALYGRFMLAREHDLLRESVNSTVPRLEYLLNYVFFPAGLAAQYADRIMIVLEKSVGFVAVFLDGEDMPLYLYEPLYLHTHAEAGVSGFDFSVIVPAAAQPCDVQRMTSLLRTYALPDKTFIIINQ